MSYFYQTFLLLCITIPGWSQTAGTLDLSFNGSGYVKNMVVSTGADGTSMALQPDGKIIVTLISENNNFQLIRYTTNGLIDNSFGNNGLVETDLGSIENANDIALQPDGKIVVGGRTGPYNNANMAVVRYNSNGTPDISFGINGKTEVDYMGRPDALRSVAISPDGSIIISGESQKTPIGVDSTVIMIVKLKTNGILDSTFSDDGIAFLLPHTQDTYGNTMKVQPDGKIIVGGLFYSSYPTMIIARFNTNGILDPSFGSGGITYLDFGQPAIASVCNSLFIQTDGKIIAGGLSKGYSNLSGGNYALARLKTNGTIDSTFGTYGKTITDMSNNGYSGIQSITAQPDGKIIAAGYSYDSSVGRTNLAMARYTANGLLDNSFNGTGKMKAYFSSVKNDAKKVLLQNDGKILTVGSTYDGTNTYLLLTRFNNDLNLGIKNTGNEVTGMTVYPNPVNSHSVLQYTLTVKQKVSIVLVDMQGKIISEVLKNDNQTEGIHTITLSELSAVPAGVYFVQLVTSTSRGFVKIVK